MDPNTTGSASRVCSTCATCSGTGRIESVNTGGYSEVQCMACRGTGWQTY